MTNRVLYRLACNALACLLSAGCAQDVYRYGVASHGASERYCGAGAAPDQERNPIAYGGDYPRLDRIEQAVRVPIDIVKERIPFRKTDQDEKPAEELRRDAIALAHAYIEDNGLYDVYVDVRKYEPREQWDRLVANERMSPAVKYTCGSLSIAKYTLLPGRLFQSDEYNPFTNTINLNSSKPIEALCEAGSAKQHLDQSWPGIYAASQHAPFVPIGHKAQVASDVLTYAHVNGRDDLEKKLYAHTYADLAKSSVGQTFSLFPVGTGVTQFVVPIAGEFVAEKLGGVTGKVAAKKSLSRRAGREDTPKPRETPSQTSVSASRSDNERDRQ